MDNNKEIAVVIPVYKSVLNENEKISLSRCFEVLGDYPIIFVAAKDFIINEYTAFTHDVKYSEARFSNDYFEDIAGYNRLLKSEAFYKEFSIYKYILIYQLDAFVFRNELSKWADAGYDYIGAPWFKGYGLAEAHTELTAVGNGGFSLRNISAASKILYKIKFFRRLKKFWFKSRLQSIVRYDKLLSLLSGRYNIKDPIRLKDLFFEYPINEDIFWSQIVPEVFADYKVAPVSEAIKFSFEVNPSKLFKMNNNELPFGCHAWEKYEPEFWQPLIAGYSHA